MTQIKIPTLSYFAMHKPIKSRLKNYLCNFFIFFPSLTVLMFAILIFFLTIRSVWDFQFFKEIFLYRKILFFSFYQAFFGSTLVLVLAIFSIVSFSKLVKSPVGFIFEKLILIPFFLPSIVGCLCILVFLFYQKNLFFSVTPPTNEGNFYSRWIGLLLCYIFYYLPYFLKNIEKNIPALLTPDTDRLTLLLGIKGITYFRFIVWPLFKTEIMALYILTFLYCMQSFTTILLFGGPPDFLTIELAIYDLITVEKKFRNALQLSFVLMFFNLLALYAFTYFKNHTKKLPIIYMSIPKKSSLSPIDYIIALVILGFLGLPLLSLLVGGFDFSVIKATLNKTQIWGVLVTSLLLSFVSAIWTSIMTFFFLEASFILEIAHSKAFRFILFELPSNILIIISPSIMVTILYVFVPQTLIEHPFFQFWGLCGLLGFSFVPNMVRALSVPYIAHKKRYSDLCLILGIRGILKFKKIDWPLLRSYIGYGLSIPIIFTLCDVKSILFLSNGTLRNLPLFIYDHITHKNYSDACSLSLILLSLILLINLIISKFFKKNKHAP